MRTSADHELVDAGLPQHVAATAEFDPARHIVQVPVARFVELDCDHCLRGLEARGVRVDRSKGSSAIDIARNIRAADAVREGFESILFIDSDMLFSPDDAIALLKRPEPVVAGLYAAKKLGDGQINASFAPDVERVRFGDWASAPVKLQRVGAGFLRIKVAALKHIAKALELPYCRMADRFAWPFFQPMVIREDDEWRYLGEDYAFCQRCLDAGIQPMGDTSFRLYHIGDYPYGVEEASGVHIQRSRNIEYIVNRCTITKPGEEIPPEL